MYQPSLAAEIELATVDLALSTYEACCEQPVSRSLPSDPPIVGLATFQIGARKPYQVNDKLTR